MKLKIKFSNLKSILQIIISAQVMWRNLERLINRERRSNAGDDMVARGASDRMIK